MILSLLGVIVRIAVWLGVLAIRLGLAILMIVARLLGVVLVGLFRLAQRSVAGTPWVRDRNAHGNAPANDRGAPAQSVRAMPTARPPVAPSTSPAFTPRPLHPRKRGR